MDDQLRKYYNATAYARRRKHTNDEALDFASYVFLACRRDRRTSVPRLYVDYLRETKVDKRSKSWKSKAETLTVKPLYEEHHTTEPFNPESIGLLDDLPPFDRACLILQHKWGLECEEIAELFGISRARVTTRSDNAKRVVRERNG